MAPESASADVYTDVADASFLVTVPTDVLPNGLPFGNDLFRNIWVGPAFNLIIAGLLVTLNIRQYHIPFHIAWRIFYLWIQWDDY